jgi:hypothetical protein
MINNITSKVCNMERRIKSHNESNSSILVPKSPDTGNRVISTFDSDKDLQDVIMNLDHILIPYLIEFCNPYKYFNVLDFMLHTDLHRFRGLARIYDIITYRYYLPYDFLFRHMPASIGRFQKKQKQEQKLDVVCRIVHRCLLLLKFPIICFSS